MTQSATHPLAVVPGHSPGPPPLLDIEHLEVRFASSGREIAGVRDVSLSVWPGEILGVAGESGSGKTATALSVMGLLPETARVSGSIRYRGQPLLGLSPAEQRRYRGREIAMVFQETVTALNPVQRIREQMLGAVRAHYAEDRTRLLARVRSALESVQLVDVERVLRSYPDELSGGMCQRVMIAMALGCGSQLLIADEPTTALDVSVQAEILTLLRNMVTERGLTVILISHDLAVLNEVCSRLVVMYRGEVVEAGATRAVLREPRHPYTAGLIACLPRLGDEGGELPEILGVTGHVDAAACLFRPRCPFASEPCAQHPELEVVAAPDGARLVRCWRQEEIAGGDLMAAAWSGARERQRGDV